MNRSHSNADKKAWRVLKCREIESKEVDNILTGNKEVRLVPSKHLVVSNCLKTSGRYLQRNNFLSLKTCRAFSFSFVLKTSWRHFKNMLRTSWRRLKDALEDKKLLFRIKEIVIIILKTNNNLESWVTIRADSIVTSRPGGRWVYTFFVILRDGTLGVWVVLD